MALEAVHLPSIVNCRAVYIRNGIEERKGLEEHEEAHWDGNVPLMFNSTAYSLSQPASHLWRREKAVVHWLRILPLGASIVLGKTSSPEDGFRKPLWDHLRIFGFKVNMVGGQ